MGAKTDSDRKLNEKADTLREVGSRLYANADTLDAQANRSIKARMLARELPDNYVLTKDDFDDGISMNGPDGHSFVDYVFTDIGAEVILKDRKGAPTVVFKKPR